ncbi:hypothetical protein [Streptomyces sp. IBSNAI001]
MTCIGRQDKHSGTTDPEFGKDGAVVHSPLSRAMVLLLAVTCGAAVADQ